MMIYNNQIVISEIFDQPEWDSFVTSVESGHHVQTSLWAQIKKNMGWKPLRLINKDSHRIVAGLQMLVRSYPLIGKVGYVTKGPVYRYDDSELIKTLISRLIMECKLRKINILLIQPPNKADFIPDILLKNNFQRNSLELAPTASIIIDLSMDEEKLLSQIHKSTRKNIRYGLKNGLNIIHGGSIDALKSFYDLHICTSQRQSFLPYPYEYLVSLKNILEPYGYFHLLFVEYNQQLVSALLLIPFRDTVITKLCGWSGLYDKLKPNDVMYWTAIQWSKSQGYHYVDLEGINREGARQVLQGESIPERLMHSPDHIKYKFGGNIVLYPEAYDYVRLTPYRWIFRKLEYNERKQNLITKTLDLLRKR